MRRSDRDTTVGVEKKGGTQNRKKTQIAYSLEEERPRKCRRARWQFSPAKDSGMTNGKGQEWQKEQYSLRKKQVGPKAAGPKTV